MLVAGCTYVGWDDVPTAKVRPVLHPSYPAEDSSYWWGQVADAISLWNEEALLAGCEMPFKLSQDKNSHPITLLPLSEWRYDPITVGHYIDEYTDGVGSIYVRDYRPSSLTHIPVLMHELGHAIGMTHSEETASVMTSRVHADWQITPRDRTAMREQLGCE